MKLKREQKLWNWTLIILRKTPLHWFLRLYAASFQDNQRIRLLSEGEVKAGDELFAVDFYE